MTPSSGVLTPASATTGSDGQASTTLQLGSTARTYTVTASVSGLSSVTFMVTATEPPRAATLEQGSGDGQTGETGHHLTDPLIVTVLDQYGNPLSGVTVSFSVTPTDGVLSPASVDTDSDGEASTLLQLGGTVGEYIATASVPGVSSVTFTATATAPPPPPPPARVATTLEKVSGDSQSAVTNHYLTDPLIVKVLDQDSAALSGCHGEFQCEFNEWSSESYECDHRCRWSSQHGVAAWRHSQHIHRHSECRWDRSAGNIYGYGYRATAVDDAEEDQWRLSGEGSLSTLAKPSRLLKYWISTVLRYRMPQ